MTLARFVVVSVGVGTFGVPLASSFLTLSTGVSSVRAHDCQQLVPTKARSSAACRSLLSPDRGLACSQGGSSWITGAALGAVFALRTLLSSQHVVAFPPIPRPKLFRTKREVLAGALPLPASLSSAPVPIA